MFRSLKSRFMLWLRRPYVCRWRLRCHCFECPYNTSSR